MKNKYHCKNEGRGSLLVLRRKTKLKKQIAMSKKSTAGARFNRVPY
jgi:hypothetical protein